jgi:hypothetical protein
MVVLPFPDILFSIGVGEGALTVSFVGNVEVTNIL